MLKLISATPSPFARKVRIALREKGLPFELLTEVPWDKTTSTPKYNPLEKLPVLILEDNSSIYESSFILQYLEWTYPRSPFMPSDVGGMIAARRLEVLCDGVCDAVVLTLFERMRPDPSSEWLSRQRRKIEGGVREMARLIGNRPFAVAQQFSLGDIAVGIALVTSMCALPILTGAGPIQILRHSARGWERVHPLRRAFPRPRSSPTRSSRAFRGLTESEGRFP